MGGALRPGRRPSMGGPLADRLREKARDRVAWTELVQLVKTVVAAVVAWILAAEVLDLPQPFLAPWSALLVVHATVYSTFSRGAQQVGATVIGVVVAWGIGIAVGVVVNLLVWPPFRDRAAARAIDAVDDRIGELLREMADGLRHGRSDELVHVWVDRTTEIDEEVDQAWALVRQSRESGWFNPRRSAREVRNPTEYGDILHRIEQSVAETRSMARSLDHSVVNVTEWDPVFKDRWVGLLDDAGAAILAPDSARQGQIRERLSELIDELSTGDLPTQHWPEYGGLILNLRNIVGSMDVVAKANPVRVRRGRPLLRG